MNVRVAISDKFATVASGAQQMEFERDEAEAEVFFRIALMFKFTSV